MRAKQELLYLFIEQHRSISELKQVVDAIRKAQVNVTYWEDKA